jgi:hypothetical protein
MDGEELTEGKVEDIVIDEDNDDLDFGDDEEGTTDQDENEDSEPEPESDSPDDDPSRFPSDLEEVEESSADPDEYPPYVALRAVSDMMTGKEAELKVCPNFNSVIELFRSQEANIREEVTRNLTRGGRLDCS